jgi:hypothetical protein
LPQQRTKPGHPGQLRRARGAGAAHPGAAADGLTNAERRAVRRIGRGRAAARQQRHRWLSHNVIVLAGTLAVMTIIAIAFAIGPAISAARGDGTPGWFTDAGLQCIRRLGCSWVGTFVSKSGHQVIPGVDYDGSLPASTLPGARTPAIYPGGLHAVFPPHGSYYWIPAILLMLLVGGAVAFFLWISPLGTGPRTPDSGRGAGLA